jgi:hypothetical protein
MRAERKKQIKSVIRKDENVNKEKIKEIDRKNNYETKRERMGEIKAKKGRRKGRER